MTALGSGDRAQDAEDPGTRRSDYPEDCEKLNVDLSTNCSLVGGTCDGFPKIDATCDYYDGDQDDGEASNICCFETGGCCMYDFDARAARVDRKSVD